MQVAAIVDIFDGAQLAVCDVLLSIRRCELYAVALTECALCLAVERYTMQPARIVTHLLAILTVHRHQIFFFVRARDASVLSGLDAVRLAASRVPYYIARFVLSGPLPVGARDLLTRH